MDIKGIYKCDAYNKEDLPDGEIITSNASAIRRRYIINGLIEEEKDERKLIVVGTQSWDSKDPIIHGFDKYDFVGTYKEVGIQVYPFLDVGGEHKVFLLK